MQRCITACLGLC